MARAFGRCELCDEPPRLGLIDRKLFIDHDHQLGMTGVRGLVCPRCNRLLASVDAARRPPTAREALYLRNAWHFTNAPTYCVGDIWAARRRDRARYQRAMDHLHRYVNRYGSRPTSVRLDELTREALAAGAAPSRIRSTVGAARLRRLEQTPDHDPTPSG